MIKRSLHPIIMEINLQDAIKKHKFPEKKNGWSMETYLPCIMQNACLATKELIMLLLKHAHWCFGLKRHFFALSHHTYNTVAEPWLNLNKIFGRNLRVSSNHGREMPGAKTLAELTTKATSPTSCTGIRISLQWLMVGDWRGLIFLNFELKPNPLRT